MSEKEKIVEILAIERELKARKENNKLARYNTGDKVHVKQVEFHKCLKRNRWVFGGNRSGKTECGAAEAVYWARGIHPYRKNRDNVCGWVVSLSYEVQRDVAQAKVLYYLNPEWIEDIVMTTGKKGAAEYGVIDYIVVKNVTGGLSRIGFKSCEAGREKFQGASLDFVWFDEEPPKDIYDECRMRIIDRRGELWGTMTPLKGLTWVYDEIYLNCAGDDEVWHEHMEWADNPFLEQSETKALSATLSKDTLESRRYGRFREAEGIVYKEFDERRDVVEPRDLPAQWQENIAIDPGLNNPLAALFLYVDFDGNVFVAAEHYEAGRDIDYHAAAINSLADRLGWKRDGGGRLRALIDSAANQRTLACDKSVTQLFYEKGIACDTRVNKGVFGGIAAVKDYFAAGRIKIFANCVNLIRELKSYWWGKNDAPLKKDDHALDALRYFITSRPAPPKPAPRALSEIERDKRKLIAAAERDTRRVR